MFNTILSGIFLYFVLHGLFKLNKYFRLQEEQFKESMSEFAGVCEFQSKEQNIFDKVKNVHDEFYEFNRHQSCQYFNINPYIKLKNNTNVTMFKPIKKQYWPQRNIRTNI